MNIGVNLTIFGGTGDLTFRKLLPALYMLEHTGSLPADSRVVIIGRRAYESEQYRAEARGWVEQFSRLPFDAEVFARLAARVVYFRMDFTDPAAYPALAAFYARDAIAAHIFYFAVAPRFFADITDGLRAVPGAGAGKVVIEKPFGETLDLARALNRRLEDFFAPDRIYRIDHYLGKEMVRNIQAIRFTNAVFAHVWCRECIEAVEISALEDVGVETRGGYYDQSGALMDMVQNHLFQVLTILAMERPADFSAAAIHAEQLKVLRALRPFDRTPAAETLVLGQYEGYTAEPKVDPLSRTETFAAMKLFIDNDRWRGTPFFIRTGKKTGVRETEIAVVFRRAAPDLPPDVLRIKVQPTEGVGFGFNIKEPGESERIIPAVMDFCQSCNLEYHRNTPEAYERLLAACIRGDQAWFSQWDQIEASWSAIAALRQQAAAEALPVYRYAPGSRGPAEAAALPAGAGLSWIE